MKLELATKTTKTADLEVTGVTSSDYDKVFKWYLGSTLIATTTADTSSMRQKYTGLSPSTKYTASVGVHDNKGKLLITLNCDFITDGETANYVGYSATRSTIIAKIGNLVASPNYTREVKWYWKKKSASNYKYATTTVAVSVTKAMFGLYNLAPDTWYSFKIEVWNSTKKQLLFTKVLDAKTTVDVTPAPDPTPTPVVNPQEIEVLYPPVPDIIDAKQIFRGDADDNKVYAKADVICDGDIQGAIHNMYYNVGGGGWTSVGSNNFHRDGTKGTGYIELTIPSGYSYRDVRFKYEIKGKDLSDPYHPPTNSVVYPPDGPGEAYEPPLRLVGRFKWTTPKVQGNPIVITAEEWNRLIAYTELVGEALNHGVDVDEVAQGELISATAFNALKSAICSVIEQDNDMVKKPGDAIKASDIDSLRTGINSAEGE